MRRLAVCLLGLVAIATAAIVPGKAFDRFITIWLENQDFDKVTLDKSIQELKKQGILLNRYYAQTHPSQPNYLAAVSGDYFGLDHDGFVRIPQNVSTICDVLVSKDISWGGYFEDLPGPGYMAMGSDGPKTTGQWSYVRKHNPFVSYDSINMDGRHLLALQSFDDFQQDLAARIVPQFVFLTPNMLNDGHNTTLDYATNWAHGFLPPLLADDAFGPHERTLILLTYDESETYGKPNHIVSLLLGSGVPPSLRGTTDDTFYTHYSILATLENNWGLPHLGRYDLGANVFQLVAAVTGYQNSEPPSPAGGRVDNSVSYPGFLSKDPARFVPIPPPNLNLAGAGGAGVFKDVRDQWGVTADQPTPYDGSGAPVDGNLNLPVYVEQKGAAFIKDGKPGAS